MSPNTWWSWAIACSAGTLLAASPATAQCQYDVTVIQAPDVCGILGPTHTSGAGLNENGAVVGSWKCPVWDHDEAFVWTPDSGLTTLARPTGVRSARAADISDDGVIVGTYIVTNVGRRGFVYDKGRFTELPPLPGGAWSWASAINEARKVVGGRSIGDGVNPHNAFIWSASGGFIDLGVMNGPLSDSTDISEQGKVVGWTGIVAGADEAFLWEDGDLTLLGPIPGGFTSLARATNNIGQVVGSGLLEQNGGPPTSRAFVWQNGEMITIEPLAGFDSSAALDIDDLGQCVGFCSIFDSSDRKAFLWQNGQIFDLNDLVASGLGILVKRAWAMNNKGQIVADGGAASGNLVTFLLTPVDRPLGDLDGDCRVRVPDLLTLLAAWGRCSRRSGCPADLNNDGTVNQLDLVLVIENWG